MKTKVPVVYAYNNFRRYLADYQSARQQNEGGFSKSAFSKRLGLPNTRSFFTDVLSGKKVTPAAQAKVSVFQVSDTARTPIEVTSTDNSSAYSLSTTKTGTYNIWAEKNGLVALQDSVYLSSTRQNISNDTLDSPGSITAFVGMQPSHNPQTVTVQVLGSDRYSNVEQNGRFTIDGLASGTYYLRFVVSTLPNYTPTFKKIFITAGHNDVLRDTIKLIYSGIPAVMGLKAIYDTIGGIVTLQWNDAKYFDLQDYLIFRDPYDSVNQSDKAIAWRLDTVFIDTVFQGKMYPEHDTGSHRLKYRVAVRNNAGDRGTFYRFADVMVVSPLSKRMLIRLYPALGDSIPVIGRKFKIFAEFRSPIGTTVHSIVWNNVPTMSVIATDTISTVQRTIHHTLLFTPGTIGNSAIECVATDSKGAEWRDTIRFNVRDSLLTSDTSIFFRSYSFHVPSQFGIHDTYFFINSANAIIGDTLFFTGHFHYSGSPSLSHVKWIDASSNSVIATHPLGKPQIGAHNYWFSDSAFVDSLRLSWPTTGIKKILCMIVDSIGRSFIDTISVHIFDDTFPLDSSVYSRSYHISGGRDTVQCFDEVAIAAHTEA